MLAADAAPGLRLIPGSVEQRGTDLIKAMKGDIPFIRSAPDNGSQPDKELPR